MQPVCLVAGLLFWFFFFPLTAHSKPDAAPDYLAELQQQARQKRLAHERVWHLLLKYDRRPFIGVISEADGMEFFNSPQGKTDPEAELVATLASFFVPLAEIPEGKEHPQCNFPARFKWLSQQLVFDSRLKIQTCDRLDRWMKNLDPVGATLVFASYFMNNPASMFGHTLLRIDSRKTGSGNNLMNYGANYAANPDTDNPFLYAVKGLFGSFEGRFAIFPYYTKVQEYNNWESRDLWEYELKFTEDQLNTMLLHLWELGGTYFDYYYFQENCSYHVLSLLEVANPSLRLKDSFFFSVIPTDTVKIVMAQEGLVKEIVYRPAVLNQMNNKRLKMADDEKHILQRLIKGELSPQDTTFKSLSTRSQALILNAYMDYLQYRSMQEKSDKEIKIPRSVLLARSRLPATDDGLRDVITHFSTRPDQGHGTDRFRLAVGHNAHEPFLELAYRPAYHDLMARAVGYDKNSEIIFMDFKLRYYSESERLRLDQAKFLSITSLNPYDPLFAKLSWRLDVGIDTLRDRNCGYCNSLKGSYGRGLSYRPDFFSPLLLFSFIDLKTEVSDHLKQNYRLGGDAEVGMYYDINEDFRIKFAGSYQIFVLGESKRFFTSQFITRYALSRDLDVRLELNRYDHNNEGVFSVNYFF